MPTVNPSKLQKIWIAGRMMINKKGCFNLERRYDVKSTDFMVTFSVDDDGLKESKRIVRVKNNKRKLMRKGRKNRNHNGNLSDFDIFTDNHKELFAKWDNNYYPIPNQIYQQLLNFMECCNNFKNQYFKEISKNIDFKKPISIYDFYRNDCKPDKFLNIFGHDLIQKQNPFIKSKSEKSSEAPKNFQIYPDKTKKAQILQSKRRKSYNFK